MKTDSILIFLLISVALGTIAQKSLGLFHTRVDWPKIKTLSMIKQETEFSILFGEPENIATFVTTLT